MHLVTSPNVSNPPVESLEATSPETLQLLDQVHSLSFSYLFWMPCTDHLDLQCSVQLPQRTIHTEEVYQGCHTDPGCERGRDTDASDKYGLRLAWANVFLETIVCISTTKEISRSLSNIPRFPRIYWPVNCSSGRILESAGLCGWFENCSHGNLSGRFGHLVAGRIRQPYCGQTGRYRRQ
ncbi:hypothetical protein D915_003861 [Fasciola hepatica]|uniref:Uncharacterized protein n=1 Tax=Fasciola hepatica TaxID=6192 RepID=A0A4E0S205_FASHE|nr:hypothetical protein D915_003861 [Fasciola hepatica]